MKPKTRTFFTVIRLIYAPVAAIRDRAELPSRALFLANNTSAESSYVTSVFVSLRRSAPSCSTTSS